MMTLLKPDKLNGKEVFRPVTTGSDGVNYVNKGLVFPPGIKVGRPPVAHMDSLVESSLNDLITISDTTGDPVIKAQAVLFKKKLHVHQRTWMTRAAENEREIVRAKLRSLGFTQASEAI
jgi:acyl CoA:acetate/3-ketoacid CoA transferase alpha subunit